MWRSESSKSVSIRGGDLVDVPPHLLAVVRVLGPVPSVMEVGDQGRDEFTADYLRPVERLEPGVTLDLLSSTTSSTKSSGAIPREEGTTGTLRTLFTDWGGVFPTFQHLIDVLPKWSKTWNGPIIWRYCQKVLRKSFLKKIWGFPDKVLDLLLQPLGGGPGEWLGEDHVVQGADVGVSPGSEAGHHLEHQDPEWPPVHTVVVPCKTELSLLSFILLKYFGDL